MQRRVPALLRRQVPLGEARLGLADLLEISEGRYASVARAGTGGVELRYCPSVSSKCIVGNRNLSRYGLVETRIVFWDV
jgi:hypothetical protein